MLDQSHPSLRMRGLRFLLRRNPLEIILWRLIAQFRLWKAFWYPTPASISECGYPIHVSRTSGNCPIGECIECHLMVESDLFCNAFGWIEIIWNLGCSGFPLCGGFGARFAILYIIHFCKEMTCAREGGCQFCHNKSANSGTLRNPECLAILIENTL